MKPALSRAVFLLGLTCLSSSCTESVGPERRPPRQNPPVAEDPPVSETPPLVTNSHVYVARADGSGITRLARGDEPTWSPDGKRIAFASDGEIYLMDADGSNVVRRTSAGRSNAPAWSPDGRTIAYSSLQGGQFGIYLLRVAADGSSPTPVGYALGWNAHPAWSPDGRRIAFVSDSRAYDFLFDLYVMDADGSNIAALVEGPFFWKDGLIFYYQPAWSPDGRKIAMVACGYERRGCYSSSRIMVVNVDGSGLKLLTPSLGYARPAWSPDGATLAFTGERGAIWTVSADGGPAKWLIPDGRAAAWSPDGAKIAFVRADTSKTTN